MPKLTRKQNILLKELGALAELFDIDYANIANYEPAARTAKLESMKRHLVIGEVVRSYTVADEFLNMEICRYYFRRNRTFIKLWKSKRFRYFNYFILEELYPLQKLRLVKAFKHVPKDISRTIESLNVLRNGLAHAFFPENLRKSKPTWKGKNIFSLEGATLYVADIHALWEFFMGMSI